MRNESYAVGWFSDRVDMWKSRPSSEQPVDCKQTKRNSDLPIIHLRTIAKLLAKCPSRVRDKYHQHSTPLTRIWAVLWSTSMRAGWVPCRLRPSIFEGRGCARSHTTARPYNLANILLAIHPKPIIAEHYSCIFTTFVHASVVSHKLTRKSAIVACSCGHTRVLPSLATPPLTNSKSNGVGTR